MVSETELVHRLREILRTSDLNTTSAGAVRRQLESDLGVELSDRKKFITQQIDQILQSGDIINVNGNGGDEQIDNGSTQEPEDDEDLKQNQDENEDEEEEEQEEEEDKDEKALVVPQNTSTSKRKGTGFTRLCSLSPQLQDFVGVSEMARTEVVKKLWAYIREKDLQDPNDRRNIKCDPKLHSLFRVDIINMFQMNKSISKHIWPLESQQLDGSAHSLPPQKKPKRQKDEDVEKPKPKEKQKKGGVTGFLIPLQLSEPFVKFLGTGETTLCRSDAVKRIWDYIKQNQLQDPSDKRRILCDEKLKELFNVDFFNGFSVTKLLTAHLTKVEQ